MTKKLVVLLIVVVVLFGLVAVQKGDEVTAVCGPTASTPLKLKGLDKSNVIGKNIRRLNDGAVSTFDIVRLVIDIQDTLNMWRSALVTAANGKPEDEDITKYKQGIYAKQQAALDACCPPSQPESPGDQGGTEPPPQESEPFDPKTLSISSRPIPAEGLSGARLAADALSRAGFPRSEIPTFVAIAKAESGFNPKAYNPYGQGMRGMFQNNWGAHPDKRNMGDWYDPYVSARVAKKIRDASVSAGKGPYYPWSTRRTAQRNADKYQDLVPTQPGVNVDAIPNAGTADPENPMPVPDFCATPRVSDTGAGNASGDLGGTITQVASLNPVGAGNWQSTVKSGNYWFVAQATTGNKGAIIHRMDSNGREIDQMKVNGPMHPTTFGMVGNVVYADIGDDVVYFAYRPGGSITKAQTSATGWHGEIAVDPNGKRAAIRNGNKYRLYDLKTKQSLGVQIKTPPGMRQGVGVSGNSLYLLSGVTNQDARVDTYSFITGKKIATRDVTDVGLRDGEKGMREPEGMWGNVMGVKVFTGDKRRLRLYSIGADNRKQTTGRDNSLKDNNLPGKNVRGGFSPRAKYVRDITMYKWGCKAKSSPCIKTIGGYSNRNIGNTGVRSDHATGNATDIMTSNVALGDQIAKYMVANRKTLNIKYVIWNRKIWSTQRSSEGWRHYNTPSGGSNHTDHVHVSVESGTAA